MAWSTQQWDEWRQTQKWSPSRSWNHRSKKTEHRTQIDSRVKELESEFNMCAETATNTLPANRGAQEKRAAAQKIKGALAYRATVTDPRIIHIIDKEVKEARRTAHGHGRHRAAPRYRRKSPLFQADTAQNANICSCLN